MTGVKTAPSSRRIYGYAVEVYSGNIRIAHALSGKSGYALIPYRQVRYG
jgi:hypothetical protein